MIKNYKEISEILSDSSKSDSFMLPEIGPDLHFGSTINLLFASNFDFYYADFSKYIARFTAVFLEVYAKHIDIPTLSENELDKYLKLLYKNLPNNATMSQFIRNHDAPALLPVEIFASMFEGFTFDKTTENQKKILRNILKNAVIYSLAIHYTKLGEASGKPFAEGFVTGDDNEKKKWLDNGLIQLEKRNNVLASYIKCEYENDPLINKYALAYWSLLFQK